MKSVMNPDFYINMGEVMAKATLPRPTRKYCKPMLMDNDGSYLPVISIEIGVFE